MNNASLPRTLRLKDLILLFVGTVIGSGIFLVPGPVLRNVHGRVGWALLVWTLGGLLSLLGALTYGELGAMRPQAGGIYVYIRECFGRPVAFLYGWALFFMISSGSLATLAVAFSTYLRQLMPLSTLAAKAVAVAMIAVVAFVNVVGTRRSANVQNVATAMKVMAIIAMTIALLYFSSGHVSTESPISTQSGSLLSGFGLAMVSVLWAYEGWQYCTFSAGETVDPQRNFPRAFLVGSVALIVIYVTTNLGYVAALGSAGAAASNSIAAECMRVVFGPLAAKLIALAILVSIFSAANGLTLTAPRVYYAMAQDGVFFHKLAEVHPRFKTPAVAVLAGSGWAALLAATGTFEQLLTYVVFTGWIFYALGAAAVFVYRRRDPNGARAFRVPGYPFTPLVFVISAAVLVMNTLVAEPLRAAVGIGMVATGAPVYLFWSRKGRQTKSMAASSETPG